MHPLTWATGDSDFSLQKALEHTAIFANAHLALSDENQLVIYAYSALSRYAGLSIAALMI